VTNRAGLPVLGTWIPCRLGSHQHDDISGCPRQCSRKETADPARAEDRVAHRSGKSAEHGAEECVTPGRLQERARIRQKRWDADLAARRMVTVDYGTEWVKTDVLGECHAEGKLPGADGEDTPGFVECEPEHRSVECVDRESRCPPAGAARHRLTKDGDVGVVAPKKPLVDGFLKRPHRRTRNTG
jgi:hypothetical protein